MAITPLSLEAVVLAKCLANWLLTGAPLLLAAPVLAMMLHMDREGLAIFVTAMALGTPSLVFTGAIGAALTVGARRGGVLLTLLVLPLYIPVLIFGVGAVEAAVMGQPAQPHLLVLGGLLLGTLPLGLWASTAALRQALE
jgi:heme exporter protein B